MGVKFMKAIAVFLICSIHWLHAQNNLIVFTEDGARFFLMLDSVRYNNDAQASVKASNLDQSSHKATISFEDPKLAKMNGMIYLMLEGRSVNGIEFTYALVKNKKGIYTLKFISSSEIVKEPEPLVPVKPLITEVVVKPDEKVHGSVYDTYKGYPNFNNNVPVNDICITPMSETDLVIASELIQNTLQVDQKLKFAESIARKNCLSVEQVMLLGKNIGFEIDRLKFIKTAYLNLIDKKRAAEIANVLQFSTSKEDYLKFLKEKAEPGAIECRAAIADVALVEAIENIKQKHHDHDRAVIAKQLILTNCFMAEQVKQLLKEFNFDNSRLEIAKEAYPKTIDKEKYAVVNEAFGNISSVNDLNKFVNSQH